MSVKNSFTCKLPIIGCESFCILNSEWSNEDVKLLLLHDNQAWGGQFQFSDDGELAELCDQLSLTKEKYIGETKSALTTHGGAQNFTYTIEKDKFTWKKCVSTKMAIKFGFINLSKIPTFDVFEKIIENTLQLNCCISENLDSAEKGKEVLEKENLLLKTKLNDLIEKKNEMETTLYSQFLCVLNEKKKRILKLKKKLDPSEFDADDPDMQESESDPFDSDTEVDSEEEEKHSPAKKLVEENKDSFEMEENIVTLPKRSRRNTRSENLAGPSTSKPQQPKNLGKTATRKKGGVKESCIMGKVPEEKENDSFEEDTFMFPKRSKRTSQQTVTVKPSTSKIKCGAPDIAFPRINNIRF